MGSDICILAIAILCKVKLERGMCIPTIVLFIIISNTVHYNMLVLHTGQKVQQRERYPEDVSTPHIVVSCCRFSASLHRGGMLVAELFENILRSLSSKAGPASGKVKSLLEDPEKKIDIEIRKLQK